MDQVYGLFRDSREGLWLAFCLDVDEAMEQAQELADQANRPVLVFEMTANRQIVEFFRRCQ